MIWRKMWVEDRYLNEDRHFPMLRLHDRRQFGRYTVTIWVTV